MIEESIIKKHTVLSEHAAELLQSRQSSTVKPGLSLSQYLYKIGSGFYSLLKGMKLTGSYFVNPGKIVTQPYPENRETLKMFPRFRGRVIMVHDEDGEHSCTACGLCEKACPNGTISVHATRNIAGRKVLGRYVYRLNQCTQCNLCIEVCPFDAIRMGHDFELAAYDRDSLIFILNNKEGRG